MNDYGGWGDILYEDEKYLDKIETAYEVEAIAKKYTSAYEKASVSAQ
jgi:hypothetical protein